LPDVHLERLQYLAENPDEAKEGEVEKLEAYFKMIKENTDEQLVNFEKVKE